MIRYKMYCSQVHYSFHSSTLSTSVIENYFLFQFLYMQSTAYGRIMSGCRVWTSGAFTLTVHMIIVLQTESYLSCKYECKHQEILLIRNEVSV
jgi:hypothetical protein